jgi:hypothetical protein
MMANLAHFREKSHTAVTFSKGYDVAPNGSKIDWYARTKEIANEQAKNADAKCEESLDARAKGRGCCTGSDENTKKVERETYPDNENPQNRKKQKKATVSEEEESEKKATAFENVKNGEYEKEESVFENVEKEESEMDEPEKDEPEKEEYEKNESEEEAYGKEEYDKKEYEEEEEYEKEKKVEMTGPEKDGVKVGSYILKNNVLVDTFERAYYLSEKKKGRVSTERFIGALPRHVREGALLLCAHIDYEINDAYVLNEWPMSISNDWGRDISFTECMDNTLREASNCDLECDMGLLEFFKLLCGTAASLSASISHYNVDIEAYLGDVESTKAESDNGVVEKGEKTECDVGASVRHESDTSAGLSGNDIKCKSESDSESDSEGESEGE